MPSSEIFDSMHQPNSTYGIMSKICELENPKFNFLVESAHTYKESGPLFIHAPIPIYFNSDLLLDFDNFLNVFKILITFWKMLRLSDPHNTSTVTVHRRITFKERDKAVSGGKLVVVLRILFL